MKKKLFRTMLVLVVVMASLMLALSACGRNNDTEEPPPVAEDPPEVVAPDPPPPPPPPEPEPEPEPEPVMPEIALWNNFVGRIAGEVQNPAPNGLSMWWSNWANLRASVDNDVLRVSFTPEPFNPEDYDDLEHYFESAMDWMGNWGEAIDMWAMENISLMRYFTIRMRGENGGEENALILHFQPNDGPIFAARFADLVLQGGGHPQVTTNMQDIVIDLEASGFPGMTNRLHIRAFAPVTIYLDELYFHGPIDFIDASDAGTISAAIPSSPMRSVSDLPIQSWFDAANGVFRWNNFVGRVAGEVQNPAPNGMPMWWSNWANLRGSVEDNILRLDFRPEEFNADDFDDLDHYYQMAMDWMGNWGEAIDMWGIDGIQYARYFTLRMAGEAGGEENRLILHFQPNDGPVYAARIADLVLQGGGHPQITTDMQDIVIDLAASGFPGMTNRLHIRAFAECVIYIDEIYFHGAFSPIDTTDNDTIAAGFPEPTLDSVTELPIREFTEALR
jgi:hypothetical protein